MVDLFNFLKDLIRAEPEVLAAFLVGVLVGIGFLIYPLYWLIGMIHGRKIAVIRSEAKRSADKTKVMEAERDEAKKKAKDRKKRIEELNTENSKLREDTEAATGAVKESEAREVEAKRKYHELAAKYNKLGSVAMSLKKQVAALNEQAKLLEKLQGQLWDLPVDVLSLVPFRPLGRNKAVIIAIINLKGGVGKTTLTANIAATYAMQKQQRVLAIDLDFQASLTNLCLSTADAKKLMIGAGRLIDNVFKDRSPGLPNRAYTNVAHTLDPKLHLMANSERFAKIEEEAKAQWIIHHAGLDVRCILRSAPARFDFPGKLRYCSDRLSAALDDRVDQRDRLLRLCADPHGTRPRLGGGSAPSAELVAGPPAGVGGTVWPFRDSGRARKSCLSPRDTNQPGAGYLGGSAQEMQRELARAGSPLWYNNERQS